jgi:plastocyanin
VNASSGKLGLRLSGRSLFLREIALRTGDLMIRRFLTAVVLAVLAGCSGYSPTSPTTGGGGTGGDPMGGNTGDTTGSGPAPTTAAVTVGNVFFKSVRNGSANSAVDTVAAGGTVTWTWANTANVPHSIRSLGSPSFTGSAIQTGDGSTHQVTFSTPGTYRYDCAVHGGSMSGRIVVR